MPYIKQEQRDVLSYGHTKVVPANAGELNYEITHLIEKYGYYKGQNYQTYNEIIGVLECAKLELYRRIVAPYEDIKMKENGDVYYDRNAVLRSKTETGTETA